MKKTTLILTGWRLLEYLAAAAAVYGLHGNGEADVLGVSMASLAAVLDAQGRNYRRVEVLGVGLTENLEKLVRVLKELAAEGIAVRWISRQDMPSAAKRALHGEGAAFADVVVSRKPSLLDAVADAFACDGRKLARFKPLCDLQDLSSLEPPVPGGYGESEIWEELYLAAGFAHRDHHDEAACGDVIKALWNGVSVTHVLSPRFVQLISDYHSGYSREIIGKSQVMCELREKLVQAARYDRANVLILGETGTGKQVAAEYIHRNSSRRNRPFEHYNCSYGNGGGNMLMDRLFGHEKGAFTGALATTRGLFDDADGGTLFLDEIGEAQADVQAMLLTVLETGCFTRIGGDRTKAVRVDVCLICATNRDLQQMVLDGTFRFDLYERICEFPVVLVPLRERREDIQPIVDYNWRQMTGKSPTHRQKKELLDYDYPGNVRELLSVLKQAYVLGLGDGSSRPEDVDFKAILDHHKAFNGKLIEGLARQRMKASIPSVAVEWPDRTDDLLALHAAQMYEKYGHKASEAAVRAGLSPNTFKKYLARSRCFDSKYG